MHDLNTINRLNLEAFAESIHKQRATGRHVLAKYEGAHLVSIETFSDGRLAQVAFDTATAAQHGGERNVLYAPTAPALTYAENVDRMIQRTRDQSEGRPQPYSPEQLNAFSCAGTDVTLGDYIARKTDNTGGVAVFPSNEN